MNRRVLQTISVLLLVLMGAAVMHEVLPHHCNGAEHGGGETPCALCVLLAFTAVVVLAVIALDPVAAPAAPLPRSLSAGTPAFRRIRNPRSPPLQYC